MRTIAHRLEGSHGNLPPQITSAYAYIDKFDLFFPWVAKPAFKLLKRLGYWELGHWGLRVSATDLSQREQRQLPAILQCCHGVTSGIEVAVDFQSNDPERLAQWLRTHLILRWRRKGYMHNDRGTVYWVYRSRSYVLVLYWDRHNKVTGELGCVHLELRFLRAKSVKRAGLDDINKVLDELIPRELFARYVKQHSCGTRYVNTVLKRGIQAQSKKAAQRLKDQNLDPVTKRYWLNHLSGRRLTHMFITVLNYDCAQIVAQARPKRAQRREEQTILELIPTFLAEKAQLGGNRKRIDLEAVTNAMRTVTRAKKGKGKGKKGVKGTPINRPTAITHRGRGLNRRLTILRPRVFNSRRHNSQTNPTP
jgi:hypothetical protein